MIFENIKYGYLLLLDFLCDAFSFKEFKKCLNDNCGGLVFSFDNINLPDKDWLEYKRLKVVKSVKSINPKDLPNDFCPKACKLVDEFHKKTANQDIEWMLYFDYRTGKVIYCWKGEDGKTGGLYDAIHFRGRHIASVHNHPKKFYSFPSLDNFEILEKDFEDYEIICSNFSFWVIGYKGILDNDQIDEIKNKFHEKFAEVNREVISNFNEDDVGMIIDVIFNIIINKKKYS